MTTEKRAGRPRERKGPRPGIARVLIEARERRGLSQVAAAAELSVTAATLAKWESGSLRPSAMAERLIELWIRCGGGETEGDRA